MSLQPFDAVSYEDRLPLSWQQLDDSAPPSDRLIDQNLRALAAVAVLEERHMPSEDGSVVEAEVQRLHQKVDVLLDLLGALLRARRGDQQGIPLRLSCQGVCWAAADAPAVGERGMVSLQLHACVEQPFAWPAEIVGTHDGKVCARFAPLGGALEAALQRHVFLHHRRSVAGRR